jgi:hypothetical protein
MWNSLYKFAFVRNPWDLVVSRYHWERKGRRCSIEDFRAWLSTYVTGEPQEPPRNAQGNIVQAVWEETGGFSGDLQSPYMFDGGECGAQFIGRYESLVHDFAEVSRQLAVDPPPLSHLKGGFRRDGGYRAFYDDASRCLVDDAFGADIDHFGYRF